MGLIALVPFTPEHITPEYLGWLNDRDLMRFSRHRDTKHTEASAREYLASFDGTANKFWAVISYDGHMVGTMTAYREKDACDLGIMIGEGGKGYGRDAWGQAMYHCGARRITAGTARDNIAMLKIFALYQMRLTSVDETNICVELILR